MLLSISNSEAATARGPRLSLLAFAASLAVALLLIAVTSEWLIRTQVLPQDTRAAHLRLLATADSADAAFGDSHVARGFDAQHGFLNLAYPSENIEDMIAKTDRHFAERAPGRVILQADPHLFSPYRVHSPPASDTASTLPAILSERHRPRLLAYWEAFLRGAGRMHSKVKVTPSGSLLSDGDLSQVSPRKRLMEARLRADWHQLVDPDTMEAARARYSVLVDGLATRGARLCLVAFPVSTDYAREVAPADHESAVTFFRQEAQRVGATFVDARRAVSDPALFRDVDHLNRKGAPAFSEQLLRTCFGG